jgi:uncharacterized cupredoxin-like copper-binding protein
MKKLLVVNIMMSILALNLAACGPKQYKFDVDMQEFRFEPDTISVPAGTPVTLNLTNSGTLEHEFVIMLLGKEAVVPFANVDKSNIYWEHTLGPGKKETVTFTAPSEPGDYQIVCGTAGHLEQGMKGILTVTQ